MGDFEDTFGAGADASEIIDGYASERRREAGRERWRLAKALGLPFQPKEKSKPSEPDDEARRLGLPTQAQIDRAVALAKAAEERMEARIREAEAKKS